MIQNLKTWLLRCWDALSDGDSFFAILLGGGVIWLVSLLEGKLEGHLAVVMTHLQIGGEVFLGAAISLLIVRLLFTSLKAKDLYAKAQETAQGAALLGLGRLILVGMFLLALVLWVGR
jgi:hypothetical protein